MKEFIQAFYYQTVAFLPKAAAGILIFFGFWVAARFVKEIVLRAGRHAQLDFMIINLLSKTSQISMLILGLITALGTLGVNVSAVVAGLGLTGFALGLALKDALSNVLA